MNALSLALAAGLIALGGGVGAVIRALLTRLDGRFPAGILAANAFGALLAGVALGWLGTASLFVGAALVASEPGISLVAALLVSALAGGLSTFSTWAGQTIALWRLESGKLLATLNLAANLVLPVAFAYAGMALGAVLHSLG